MTQIAKPFQASRTLTENELCELMMEFAAQSVGLDGREDAVDWLRKVFGHHVEEVHFVIFSDAATTDGAIRWLKKFMKSDTIAGLYSILHRKERINVRPVQTTTFEFVQEEPEDDFGKSEGSGKTETEAKTS